MPSTGSLVGEDGRMSRIVLQHGNDRCVTDQHRDLLEKSVTRGR